MQEFTNLDNINPDDSVHVIDQDDGGFKPIQFDEPGLDGNDGVDPPVTISNNNQTVDNNSVFTDNALIQYLKKHSIEDPTKIKYENEAGTIEERDFNSMTIDEQLEILEQLSTPDLSQHETEVINYLRQNNKTLDQVVEYFAEKKLQDYLQSNPDQVKQQVYEIDQFSDDELYLYDLKSKFEDFTDEEISAKLETAKGNEELYKKEVEFLRKNYKEAEIAEKQDAEEQETQKFENFKSNLVDAAQSFNEVSLDYSDPESDSLVIEDEDKHQILSYLLDPGPDGRSQLFVDLDDPQTLIELAWFRTHGKEVISGISKYWKDVLKTERKEMAELKKKSGSTEDKTKTTTVVQTPTTKSTHSAFDKSQPLSLDNLGR